VKTSHIWVEAVVTAMDAGEKVIGRRNTNVPNQRWPAERMIEPGADMWARETVLRSDSLVTHDKEAQARCIFVTITLLRVEFEDGTSWMAGVKEAGKSLKFSDEPPNHEHACKVSSPSETGGHEVFGAIVRRLPEPEKLINWEEGESYSIFCPLELRSGKFYAICPLEDEVVA
jgi:hypothetical protein